MSVSACVFIVTERKRNVSECGCLGEHVCVFWCLRERDGGTKRERDLCVYECVFAFLCLIEKASDRKIYVRVCVFKEEYCLRGCVNVCFQGNLV